MKTRTAVNLQAPAADLIRMARAVTRGEAYSDARIDAACDALEKAMMIHADEGRAKARKSDPWTSQVAADRVTPTGKAQKAVLDMLLTANGGWVSGARLTYAGGSEGLRRVRELRTEKGWPVERKATPSGPGWLYRIQPSEGGLLGRASS